MIRKFIALVALVATPTLSVAQTAAAPPASASPVSDAIRAILGRRMKAVSAAADAMPADKFSFKPTADQITFAHLTLHIAESNTLFCSKISGAEPPADPKLTDTDSKDKLVANLKASFEYCTTVLAKVDDSHLGDSVTLGSGPAVTRAAVNFFLASSLADHYAAQAFYLRMNGILPPSAQPPKP
jgi:hypothetical protein